MTTGSAVASALAAALGGATELARCGIGLTRSAGGGALGALGATEALTGAGRTLGGDVTRFSPAAETEESFGSVVGGGAVDQPESTREARGCLGSRRSAIQRAHYINAVAAQHDRRIPRLCRGPPPRELRAREPQLATNAPQRYAVDQRSPLLLPVP